MAGMSGSLTWNLIANADKYAAGMNKAAASTRAAARQQEQMSRQTRLLRGAVAAVSAAAIVKFGSDSVKAFKEAEVAQAKLTQAYAKFPKLADVNIGAMRAMNSELQKVTVYEDDATAAMQARLAMYDLTGQQLRELTPLVMDYASATGQDLASAGDAIGKALLGNTRALKSVGISYKATGDRARDYAAIQSLLSEKVGGFAEAEGKTAAGQAARLANAYGDLQESVGEALLPALEALVGVLTPLTESFNELPKGAKTASVVIGAVGAAALLATPRILAFNSALAASGPAGAKASKGIGAAVGAFAALGAVKFAGDWLRDFTGNTAKDGEAAAAALAGMSSATQLTADDFSALGVASSDLNALMNETFNRSAWTNFLNAPNITDHIGLTQDAVDEWRTFAESADAGLSVIISQGGAAGAQGEAFFRDLTLRMAAAGATADQIAESFPGVTAALAGTSTGFAATGEAADDAADDVKTFAQELDALNNPTRDVTESQIALIDSSAELAKSMREGGKSFDLSTEAGRKNLDALMETTSGIEDMGAALEASGVPRDKAIKAMEKERDALVKNLEKMGVAPKRAQALVDKYLKIPPAVQPATDAVNALASAIDRLPSNKTVTIKVNGANKRVIDPSKLASGGLVTGPGTGTSDDVAAWLSNGEYVLRASTVRRIGVANLDRLNTGTGFASGGLVDTGFASGSGSSGSSTKRRRKRSGKKATRYTWDVGMRDSIRGANSPLDAFDMDAYEQATQRAASATEDLAAAQKAIADARRAMNQAGTPAEQAAAAEQMAQATADHAAAQRELNSAQKQQAATKVTGANILASFRGRAQKLDKFRKNLDTLRKRGLAPAILREILDAGLDEGGAMAAALVADGNVTALNKTWGWITDDATAMAKAYGDKVQVSGSSGGGSTGTTGSTGSGAGIAISLENASRPFVVKVDSEAVWKGLLKLKKSKGGVSLGLG